MRKLLLYIMVWTLFCFSGCCHKRIQPTVVNTITKDSVYYNVIHKDTTVYHHIEADTLKATQDINLDNLGQFRDTLSVLDNNYSISVVEASRVDENNLRLNHFLFQKKLDIGIPVKFVYLDKYYTKYEYKEVPVEVIVEKPIRDKLFWFSIIINVVFIMMILMKIKKRIGI